MSNTHTSEKVYFSSFFCLFFRKTILSDKDYKNTQRPLHVKTHTLKNELELPITLYFHIMPFWKTHPSSTLYVSPNLPPHSPTTTPIRRIKTADRQNFGFRRQQTSLNSRLQLNSSFNQASHTFKKNNPTTKSFSCENWAAQKNYTQYVQNLPMNE